MYVQDVSAEIFSSLLKLFCDQKHLMYRIVDEDLLMTKVDIYETIERYILDNQDKFYRFVFSYAKDKDKTLDIVQNAICKAFEKYRDIRDVTKINSWFYKVLLNETYSYLKKYNREYLLPREEIPEGIYVETAYDKDEGLRFLVDSLSDELKTVVVLRYFEDMSLSEISDVTKTNLNTVKTRLYSALKKLKKKYKEAGYNE